MKFHLLRDKNPFSIRCKVPGFGVFSGLFFPRIRTEYRDLLSKYPLSVRIRKNIDKTEKKPNSDTFHAVQYITVVSISLTITLIKIKTCFYHQPKLFPIYE